MKCWSSFLRMVPNGKNAQLSPSALIGMVRVTLLVLLVAGRAIGSFDASPRGLWQAVVRSFLLFS